MNNGPHHEGRQRRTVNRTSRSPDTIQDIAVIGMACRFPGARDYREFWKNLQEGRSCIREIPPQRWDWRAYWGDPLAESNKINSRWGGFIEDIDAFDSVFFGIAAREAEVMDPQQRIMLEMAWTCFEDAGLRPAELSGENIGVFIGTAILDYKELEEKECLIDAHYATGIAHSVIAHRISYHYNLKGPSFPLDTACSSSLTAIHAAVRSLRDGECGMALAGGVNILLTPHRYISFSKMGILSPSGCCRSFDENADGIVRGEGAGLLLLKSLEEALRDGDFIHGIIKGTAINHSGKTYTISYPSPDAQAAAINQACKRAGITPASISYIEAHGTGTPKGDPVEFEGLLKAFQADAARSPARRAGPYCGLGSVKTNIGHLESAAGVAGVIKVLLSMEHGKLPGLSNFKQLNNRITIENTPFYVVDSLRDWVPLKGDDGQDIPRRAGVSSFGFSGSNAHVVLEEAPVIHLSPAPTKSSYLICLSAKTEEALRRREKDFAEWIQTEGAEHEPADISATLLLRRQHFEIRSAFVVKDVHDLRLKLDQVLKDYPAEGYFTNKRTAQGAPAAPSRDSGGAILTELHERGEQTENQYRGKLLQLAQLYARGCDLDWKLLCSTARKPRICLPSYPFDRHRHWLPKNKSEGVRSYDCVSIPGSRDPEGHLSHHRSTAGPNAPYADGKPSGIDLTPLSIPDQSKPLTPIHPTHEDPQSLPAEIAPSWPDDIRRTSTEQNRSLEKIIEDLTASLAAALHEKPDRIDVNAKLTDLGLDSIIGVEWTDTINRQYGTCLKATMLYQCPTIREFAGMLVQDLNNRGSVTDRPAASDFGLVSEQSPASTRPEKNIPTVVDLRQIEPGIVQVTMHDRVHKNTFSPGLISSLSKAFGVIEADADCKVVILTGYDSYFACGGTKDGLLDIYEGKTKFTDVNIYSLALDCKVPVVAAMQGHGIGAGWSMGMFCDFIVMSRDSIYTSNYMKYGFTPGAGATLIFPEKLGVILAQEILFTGKQYRGSELEARCVPFPILPSREVLPYAIQLAKDLAKAPRRSLIALKDHMAKPIREKLSAAYKCELTMHEQTFVNQPEVKERIQEMFGAAAGNDYVKESPSPTAREQKQVPYGQILPTSEQPRSDAIAVIGMAGQFPKSNSLADFWDNLARGRNCISWIPSTRWRLDDYYDPDPEAPGKSYCKWMGALEHADKFDPLFFSISPFEAVWMDPQQRLFLEACWKCIEDAGINPSSLSESRCGVFAGCSPNDYGQQVNGNRLHAQSLTGGATSILSARISYMLNLKGPCLAVDTACSSSLTAIAEACNSLVLRTSDLALAGGVCVIPGPSMHVMTSKAGMLSKDGRCFTFDNRANGFVPGEGVGVVLLKRLSDAERDRDPIYGVIRGWGINQDGRTNGITAPNLDSQVLLQQDVYRNFHIDPGTISLVEAHGTATKLGDPIEVEALTRSFRSFTQKSGYCALGSVKSNIGHLLAAAGAAGMIKVLLALRHRQLPPTINFEKLNEHISLDNSPFYINTALRQWNADPGMPRRACVSSFGFSGTNVHVVIEEYSAGFDSARMPALTETNDPVLFLLSARTGEQLRTYAVEMRRFVLEHQRVDLSDIAYTLQVGRDAMDHRLAFVADSRDAVLDVLQAFIDDRSSVRYEVGRVKRDKNGRLIMEKNAADVPVETGLQRMKLLILAKAWVRGAHLDWERLYGDQKPRRLNLPSYPFARERYWIPEAISRTSEDRNNKFAPTGEGLPDLSEHCEKPRGIQLRSLTDDPMQMKSALYQQAVPKDALRKANSSSSQIFSDPESGRQISISGTPSTEKLVADLTASLAGALNMKRSDVDPDRQFIGMGVDSIIGVEWIRIINTKYGTSIAGTKLYDYPTIRDFALFLQIELGSALATARRLTVTSDTSLSLDELIEQVHLGKLDTEQADKWFQDHHPSSPLGAAQEEL